MGQPAGITQQQVEQRNRQRDFVRNTARYVCACLIDDALSNNAALLRTLMRTHQLNMEEAQAAMLEMKAIRARIDPDGDWEG